MTAINKECIPAFCDEQQPLELFNDSNTLEEGVEHLLKLALVSQRKLIMLIHEFTKDMNGVTYYNPGIKSYDSALRKAKASYVVPNQIRQLTDVYRGTIIFDNPSDLKSILKKTKKMLKQNRFEIVFERNSFDKPLSDGYRDINFKIKDLDNFDLVGELQINQCSIKIFTEFLGHKAYEIIRTLPSDIKDIVSPYLNELTYIGYDKRAKELISCDKNCGKCIKTFNGGTRKKKLSIKNTQKRKTKKLIKY